MQGFWNTALNNALGHYDEPSASVRTCHAISTKHLQAADGLFSASPYPAQNRSIACKATQDSENKPDFIERAFGALFGSKALGASEPFGMKRMSDEAYNEQSLANTTEFADPVEGDTDEVALFRPLLAKTRLERLPLR